MAGVAVGHPPAESRSRLTEPPQIVGTAEAPSSVSADIAHLTALPEGFTPLARTPDSGALDYVRSALLMQGVDGSLTCWQVTFNTQSLTTDDRGLPI